MGFAYRRHRNHKKLIKNLLDAQCWAENSQAAYLSDGIIECCSFVKVVMVAAHDFDSYFQMK